MIPGAFVTPTQAAALAGVNRSTILRWCQAGKLKAWKVGHQWLIDRDNLAQYVAKHTEQTK